MKVNPAAIQTYQQLIRKEPHPQTGTDTRPESRDNAPGAGESRISIKPIDPHSGSSVSVKSGGGSYADLLSPQEKEALDVLFGRFRDSERFGKSYRNENDLTAKKNSSLGRLIDVKV